MDTWTLQMGYPVVTVTRNYLNNSMKIKQTRFLDGTPNPDIQVSTLSRIPEKFYWQIGNKLAKFCPYFEKYKL